jgi:cell division protein FtsN
MARGRASGSRFGTFLVLAGIGGVLTVTFVAGVWTGRHWPLLTAPTPPPPSVDVVTGKRVPEDRKTPAPSALPALTFYQELKAPLTAPPPAPKPTKTRPPDLAIASPSSSTAIPATPAAPRSEPASLPEAAHAPAVPAASTDKATRFTLQVGAYNARQPADTLRAMLAASGHDARVVEATDTRGAVRYRVQVGVFDSREAAQEAKARLATERALSSFVTPR